MKVSSLPEARHGVLHHARVVGVGGDVAGDGQHAVAEVLRQLRRLGRIALQHAHAGALGDEALHQRPAEARAAACNDCNRVVQPAHVLPPASCVGRAAAPSGGAARDCTSGRGLAAVNCGHPYPSLRSTFTSQPAGAEQAGVPTTDPTGAMPNRRLPHETLRIHQPRCLSRRASGRGRDPRRPVHLHRPGHLRAGDGAHLGAQLAVRVPRKPDSESWRFPDHPPGTPAGRRDSRRLRQGQHLHQRLCPPRLAAGARGARQQDRHDLLLPRLVFRHRRQADVGDAREGRRLSGPVLQGELQPHRARRGWSRTAASCSRP